MAKKKIPKRSQKRFTSKTERWLLPLIFVSIFVLIGIAIILLARASVSPGKTYITSITDLGDFAQPPNFLGRDGGHSALVGGKVTWIFGDTLYAPKGISKMTGDFFRSTTAAIGNITNPTQVSEPLDSHDAPYQFIPYTPKELAYNIANSRGDNRYATWPGSIVAAPDGSFANIFVLNLLLTPTKWENQGVGIATVSPGSTVAQRKVDVLFGPDEPSFRNAIRVGDMLYVYAQCTQKLCPVSRVHYTQVANRAAYVFWNGSTWVADVSKAVPVLPGSNMGSAVMYNRSLKSYVVANIPNYTHAVYFAYAPSPEGPWTTPIKAVDLPTTKPEYGPHFHPELSTDNDKTVFLSYAGIGKGVRLLKLTLDPPADGLPPVVVPTNTSPSTTQTPTGQQASKNHSSGSTSSNKLVTSNDTNNTAHTTTESRQSVAANPTNRLQNDAANPDAQTSDERSWWQKFLDFFANLFNRN